MKVSETRPFFMTHVPAEIDLAQVLRLAKASRFRQGFVSRAIRLRLSAQLAHAAFLAPERLADVWDTLALGWQGRAVQAPPVSPPERPVEQADPDLWSAVWSVAEDAIAGKLDALSITARTAALGALAGETYQQRTAAAAAYYPGIDQVAGLALPQRIRLEQLAACPHGSIGARFHALIVENKFDLEGLDRDAIGLAELPSPLDYLNTRILQSHDLWHIIAGYETTALHEIALSAFQMAQFGHAYSAQFLAVTAVIGSLSSGFGWPVLMTTLTSAWRHGRETPPIMLIDWENQWQKSVEQLRSEFDIRSYSRPYPADLIERRLAA